MAVMAAALLLTACTGNKTKAADANDSVAMKAAADSAAKAQAGNNKAATEEQAFTTPDLQTHDLKGHVKTVVQYNDETSNEDWNIVRLKFDENGHWTTMNGKPIKSFFNNGLKRDAEGRITEMGYNVGETCEMYNYKYTYDDKGRVLKENFDYGQGYLNTTYTYDDKGNKATAKAVGEDYTENQSVNEAITFTILSVDEQGNWTRLQSKISDGRKAVCKRVITYW